jgi:hypothetical protein
MQYVTRRSHRMQKHKFGVTCPGVPRMHRNELHDPMCFLPNPYRFHPSMKTSAMMFHGSDASECCTRPIDPNGCKKHKFGLTCFGVLFVESAPVPTEHEK